MKRAAAFILSLVACANVGAASALNAPTAGTASEKEPIIPRFSAAYMDKSVKPADDFYLFANGNWVKNNPVPADKARWGSFSELAERNNYLIHGLLESASADIGKNQPGTPRRQVGDFFKAGMNTDVLEKRRFAPIQSDLDRIASLTSYEQMFQLLADFHKEGGGGVFYSTVDPDAKDSGIYAFQLMQGGLSLPDRDYYLQDSFSPQRKAYIEHLKKMFELAGDSSVLAAKNADIVFNLEKELAQASRSRVDLRDPIKNYNKVKTAELIEGNSVLPWQVYLEQRGLKDIPYAVVGQPDFFAALNKTLKSHPLDQWKTYLRWHLLHEAAPYLHDAVEVENFNFFGKTLSGQEVQEPRWKRVAKVIDRSVGEALGQLYVEKYFTDAARKTMAELVTNLREVFSDHLQKLDWMSDVTRKKAMAKFEKFVQKIGHPDKFRDYSKITIEADDYLGNAQRADAFEVARQVARIGKPVDKSEWGMTPPTVNAYFNPTMNEIVFPAGILQPPFFDVDMDDAVNYGGIGAVIGHEITHGYDDEGRHYDADGNLKEWWTEADTKEFDSRAQKVVDEYNSFEALPGLHVNGKLTLGENIADLGGVSIGYDALQRAMKKDPSKRKNIDGFTPEQRFFLSFAQLWRMNIREAEQRRLITVDPHSPGKFRSVGPLMNFQEFYDAFDIKSGAKMWREPEKRAKIW